MVWTYKTAGLVVKKWRVMNEVLSTLDKT